MAATDTIILNRFPGQGQNSGGNDFVYFGRNNVIVLAKARDISFDRHTAPLSIKAVMNGSEKYDVEGVTHSVDSDSYLVLNSGQPYASFIDSECEVASFCVFFRDGLENEVQRSMAGNNRSLIDNDSQLQHAPFFQNLRKNDQRMMSHLRQLFNRITSDEITPLWIDERIQRLIELLLANHSSTTRAIEKLNFARKATRFEIYRRLHRAKDYLESCYFEPVNLTKLAQVACLSPHHFLRLFKEVFNCTPHNYLTDIRLYYAMKLLRETDRPVADICIDVGYENSSSFARLFKRKYGFSPQSVRQLKTH